jgi:hypothetical protein
MPSLLPDVEVRRRMLTQMRENFQEQGFEHAMNAEACRVQSAKDASVTPEVLAAKVAELEGQSRNAYAAARRMDEELKRLPKPKTPKKEPTKK